MRTKPFGKLIGTEWMIGPPYVADHAGRKFNFREFFRLPDTLNQTPEQIARDRIDPRRIAAEWQVQDTADLDSNAGLGIAVREYQTDIGPTNYVLFVDRQAVGVVETKPDNQGVRLTSVEVQSEGYAKARLKWVTDNEPLPFVYEAFWL